MWNNIKQIFSYIWTEFCHIVHDVFEAEEKVLMAKAFDILRAEAVTLQNAQPGISSKDMETQLKQTAESQLAGLGINLVYTAIVTVIGTVMHDLGVKDTLGNAGVVS